MVELHEVGKPDKGSIVIIRRLSYECDSLGRRKGVMLLS